MPMTPEQIRKTVDHPSHYQHPSGVECVKLTAFLPALLSNTVKYTWRAGRKEGIMEERDLRAALWYANEEMSNRRSSVFPNAPTELGRDFSGHFFRLWQWARENPDDARTWLAIQVLGELIEVRMKEGFHATNSLFGLFIEEPLPPRPHQLSSIRITQASILRASYLLERQLERLLEVS